MWLGAKLTFKKLLYDDSGVAMAYTVLASLFIFMLCVSTYAMTENIRQKMELQNACDAAAYSGAVVQADMLSRIAVLNRALSWTYLHTNRRQMDRLVGRWANKVSIQHRNDANFAWSAHCKCEHHLIRGTHYRASYTVSPVYDILMRSTPPDIASNVGYKVNDDQLTKEIDRGFNNIDSIQTALTTLRSSMNNYIYTACRNSLAANTGIVRNDDVFILLNGLQVPDAAGNIPVASYFIDGTNETEFLAFSRHTPAAMGNGVNTWWNLVAGRIQRQYTTGLNARYNVAYWSFGCSKVYGCYCVPVNIRRNITPSAGDLSPNPTPTILSSDFFGRAGSIVVAARTNANNPFVAPFGTNAANGLYDAFNGRAAYLWAISSSRAGIRLSGDSVGNYRVSFPGATAAGYTNGVWNLCEDDWDAVMIPVSRAFSDASGGAWNGSAANANAVLSQIRQFPAAVAARINGYMRH